MVAKFNERVKEIVRNHPSGTTTVANALSLAVTYDFQDVAAKNRNGCMDPKVLIVLNNATTMKKMLRSHSPSGAKKIFPCWLVGENADGSWEVQYSHSDERETRSASHLRARGGRAGQLRDPSVGLHCCAEMSKEMRMAPGLLWQMKENFGEKEGKRRVVFIVDEADLAVSNPRRDSNVLSRLSFQEQEELQDAQDAQEERRATKIRRGAREYVFGSVSITATPQALLMCTFESQDTKCGICNELVDRSDVDPKLRQGGCILGCEHDEFHFSCLQAKVRAGGFYCTTCDEERSADGGAAANGRFEVTENDIEAYTPRLTTRQLTPHWVSLDVPDNYIAHTCNIGWATNCSFVERVVTPPRTEKITSKLPVYRAYWLEHDFCTEAQWDAWAKWVLDKNEHVDIGEGFKMCPNQRYMTVTIRSYGGDPDIFEEVEATFLTLQESQRGQDAASLDAEGIKEMINDMIADTSVAPAGAAASRSIGSPSAQAEGAAALRGPIAPYRHALIMTDKTKFTGAQKGLQDRLLQMYAGDELVVATYNCKTGIEIAFTETAKSSYGDELGDEADLVADVLEKARSCVSAEEQKHVTLGDDGKSVKLHKQQVSVLYDSLKDIKHCNRVVVITGEMGGRGVAYHDSDNTRILTDMFASWPVPDRTQVCVHAESLIQNLGRVNTIHTPKCHIQGKPPPVRLWAPEALHELHKLCLTTVLEDIKGVQEKKDYRSAISETPLRVLGHRPKDGKALALRTTRPSFSKHERDERQGGEIEALANVPRLKKAKIPPFGAPSDNGAARAPPDPSSQEFQQWAQMILRICLEKGQRVMYKFESTANGGSGRTREEWVAGVIKGPTRHGRGIWHTVHFDQPQCVDSQEPQHTASLQFDAKQYGTQWRVDERTAGKYRTVAALQLQMQHLEESVVVSILQRHARAISDDRPSDMHAQEISEAISSAKTACPLQRHVFDCIDTLYGRRRGAAASAAAPMDIDESDGASPPLPENLSALLEGFLASTTGGVAGISDTTAKRCVALLLCAVCLCTFATHLAAISCRDLLVAASGTPNRSSHCSDTECSARLTI